ncbi:MAG: DNA damage-inducible protein D [Candidatus Binataceae bacterium]
MADEANIGTYRRTLDEARREALDGSEYWLARDLQEILGYSRWEYFEEVIKKAQLGCATTGLDPDNQFRPTNKMVVIGSGTRRKVNDWFLSRYACYLIAMNGNPQLPQVAFAQQYFAVETRRQEIQDQQIAQYDRVEHRKRVTATQKALSSAAKQAGVQRYGLFYDAGYKGLYGGLGLPEIKSRKRIGEKEELLDRAGRKELAAIELKNAQTEEQLISLNVQGERIAMETHNRVGREIRSAIERIGGIPPEDLPPEESVKKLEAARKRKPAKLPPPSDSGDSGSNPTT